MSMAKELFDIMNSKLRDINNREASFLERTKAEREEVMKIKVAIRAVCEHTDGETLVPEHDYHNNVDDSYYSCDICGARTRNA